MIKTMRSNTRSWTYEKKQQRQNNEAAAQNPGEPVLGDGVGEPVAEPDTDAVVDQGGNDNAGENGPGLTEATHQRQRQQLGFIADFADRDQQGGRKKSVYIDDGVETVYMTEGENGINSTRYSKMEEKLRKQRNTKPKSQSIEEMRKEEASLRKAIEKMEDKDEDEETALREIEKLCKSFDFYLKN